MSDASNDYHFGEITSADIVRIHSALSEHAAHAEWRESPYDDERVGHRSNGDERLPR